jgi:ubiquinone/menaquinone biosynthesis C-methylase UbiE
VVDVAGGIGSVILQLIKACPHLRYVVQDRPKVISDGIKVCTSATEKRPYAHFLTAQFWENEYPDALKSGRVQFQG